MEKYVKGFQKFHAGKDVRPFTSCEVLQWGAVMDSDV